MRKFCYFVAAMILSLTGMRSVAATSETSAIVIIDGQFNSFVAQNVEDNRDEAFAFVRDTYTNEAQIFDFTPDATYALKGANESNKFYVYVNDVQVKNQAEADQSGYVAYVQFKAGDVIKIYENTPYVGTVKINGQFYTFNAQSGDDNRFEPFAFTNDTYDNETRDFNFSPGLTYELKGQNQANTFFVYQNGVQVLNKAGEGQTGFEATIKFKAGDVIEIYEATPYVGTVKINGQFYTFNAQAGDDNRFEPFAFTNDTYENQEQPFYFSPGLTYTLKGQNKENSFFVYQNGVLVKNEAGEGETGYVASIKFVAGDVIEIYETTPYVATVKIDGQFYTFTAQAGEDNRSEAFVFTNETYENESQEFNFSPGLTYELKGQNKANTFFVYQNGVQVLNKAGEGQTGYEATIKFKAGDVIEIYEATPYVGTVKINGQFYTFAAQAGDDNRNEPFAFTNDTYENQEQPFYFSPGLTYTLKGQNKENSFFVYQNGVEIKNQAGEGETGYVATVKFVANDVIEICEATPYVATVKIDGQFYTFNAQAGDDNRSEPFAFTNKTYENEEQEFNFSPGLTYELKGQNEANTFFVYQNGVQVLNKAGEGQTGYEATIKFKAGDVIEIYEATPYVGTVKINGQFYTFAAQAGDDNRNEPFAFTNDTYENQEQPFYFSPGLTYTLKGQNKENSFFVYQNGVEIKNQAGEGETGYVATVKFAANDVIEIYETTPYVATVKIDGQFYTFTAQAGEDNRSEAFVFTNETYEDASQEFNFSPGLTYTLKGQNQENSFFVYQNGILVKNEAGEGETGYVASIKFVAGDVIEIFENTPYVATVIIDGQFYTFVAQAGDDNRDEAFVFTNETYNNDKQEFDFSPAVTYTLKGQNENNTFFVFVNDELVENEVEEGATGFEAQVKFNIGDVVKIFAADPSGVQNIYINEYENGKIYNLQGIEMRKENLTPGIYILNGKKFVVR